MGCWECLASVRLGIRVFVEQLRCNYNISELFQEKRIFGPTKSTMDSGLCTDTVSTILVAEMSLSVLPSRCCECGPQRPSLEETPE